MRSMKVSENATRQATDQCLCWVVVSLMDSLTDVCLVHSPAL